MQSAAAFWDKTAEKYAKSPIEDIEEYNYTLGRTRSYLTPTDRVLEVGCGTGSMALLLASNVDRIVASDVSSKMIEIAQRKAEDDGVTNVEFVTAELSDRALEREGPYDAVLAFNLLHLVEDTQAAVRQINRLLKPGGKFISKTVIRSSEGASLKFRLIKTILPLMQCLGKAPYVKFMTVRELEDVLTSQGFEITEAGNHPAISRYIVAKKTSER